MAVIWNKELEAHLLLRRGLGVTFKEISLEMGIPPKALMNKMKELKAGVIRVNNFYTPEQDDFIIDKYNKGCTNKEIAMLFNDTFDSDKSTKAIAVRIGNFKISGRVKCKGLGVHKVKPRFIPCYKTQTIIEVRA